MLIGLCFTRTDRAPAVMTASTAQLRTLRAGGRGIRVEESAEAMKFHRGSVSMCSIVEASVWIAETFGEQWSGPEWLNEASATVVRARSSLLWNKERW